MIHDPQVTKMALLITCSWFIKNC